MLRKIVLRRSSETYGVSGLNWYIACRHCGDEASCRYIGGCGLETYTVPTRCQESKKPNLKGWAKCLILLVPTAGFELAT
jgi:hypothetical protein